MSDASSTAGEPPFAALILAASRGAEDPVARSENTSHKCLVDVAGTPMLVRVSQALEASPSVQGLAISIEDAAVLDALPSVAAAAQSGVLTILTSAATPSQSVLAAAEALGRYPLLITTADNPLLTPEVIEHFCHAARRAPADVVAGVTSEAVAKRDYPETKRTFLRFRDGRYSGCNLFALTNPTGLRAVQFWDEAGRHRKRPWRLVASFGLWSLVLVLLGRLTLAEAVARAGRVMDLRAKAVEMPFPTAPIDVDKPADLALVRRILEERGP